MRAASHFIEVSAMRFDRRFLPVALAVLLPACGEESPFEMIPDEDAGEVIKEDAGPLPMFPDRGVPADEGFPEEDVPPIDAGRRDTGVDTGVRDTGVIDTGVRDTGVIDTGPVDSGPPYDPCAAASVIDLNMAGTLAGQTTTYMGSNASTGRSAPLRPLCGSASSIGYEVAFRYTPRASTRLRVSTDNAGTAANLDTVVWAQAACMSVPSGSGLGCDDDGGEDPRTYASTFTTAAAVTAGTPVYIVVAGYTGGTTTPTGAFALSVTEVVPAMAGGACDPRDAMACVTGLRCIPTGTSTTMGTCVADGAAGGRCRTAGLACDMGLTCSGVVTATTSRCRATVAVGGMCDPAGAANVCAMGANCITASGMSTCLADGAAGGRCRATGMACDATLVCSGSQTSTTSRCRTTIAVGGDCDVAGGGDPCVTGSTCLTVSGRSACVADGTANGRCRTTGTACDMGLGCNGTASSTTARCVTAVATGGACPTGSVCASGNTCLGMVCVADGSANGRCRTTGMACDAGLGCNGTASSTASRCVMAVPVGGACTSTSICASGSSCLTSSSGMVCVADGGAGTRCRAEAPRCGDGLTCSSAVSSDGWCLRPVAMSAACDWSGRSTTCPAGSACVPVSAATGACVAAVAETEPNDALAAATTVSAGAVFSGSVEGGGRDCFAINLPSGASIFAHAQIPASPGCPASGADPQVTIYRASGLTVTAQDDTTGFGLCSVIDPFVRAAAADLPAGRYVVCVNNYMNAAVPNYLLTVGFVP